MDDTHLRNSLKELHAASFAWAMTCCQDHDAAEEVLQTVYLKVLGSHAGFNGRSNFRTWLFAVIRNAARDRQRKRWWSRVVRLDLNSLAELPEGISGEKVSTVEDRDELIRIREALRGLPERQQQISHLVFYEDLTVAEAAEVMGISVGTARQHYARAKESLRIALQSLWNRHEEPTKT